MTLTHPKVNILLVDDRPENLISLAAVLESPGYEIHQASSGNEALRLLFNQEFALILMDVQMPEMDGFETARLIKSREKTRNIPIIFVTAINRDEPFVFQGYGAGAVDYILKPFDPKIIRSKVAVFADLYRKSILLKEQEVARVEIQALKRQNLLYQKYRDLIEDIHNGFIWIVDPETLRFTYVSPRAGQLLGYLPQDWTGESDFWSVCSHPEDITWLIKRLKESGESSMEQSFEHRMIDRTGNCLWFHTSLRLCVDEEAGTSEIRGLSVDVTHLKNAEEKARMAVQARDEFLSIASHELKTPLTALKLQLNIHRRLAAKKTLANDAFVTKSSQIFDKVNQQVDRLGRLIEQLLDVSQINNGKLQLLPEFFDLRQLLEEVCARFIGDASSSRVELLPASNQAILGHWDRSRIDQVITNLISNAIKYGDSKPVKATVYRNGDDAFIEVTDQGIGISEEDQKRIFKRFERAVSASDFSGLGLGLYIVHQIVHEHDGVISVKSEIGKGSTFTVRLPLPSSSTAGIASTGLTRDKSGTTNVSALQSECIH
jgi:PAS domain S-box-containing protein